MHFGIFGRFKFRLKLLFSLNIPELNLRFAPRGYFMKLIENILLFVRTVVVKSGISLTQEIPKQTERDFRR